MCEQNKIYKEYMTDIQCIDGWYMYFEKKSGFMEQIHRYRALCKRSDKVQNK